MKKIMISLAMLFMTAGGAMAQGEGPKPGSWKAYDKISKADRLMGERKAESFEQAMVLYKEAEDILKADIEKAETEQKSDKLALLYLQNGQLQNKLLTPDMNRAQQGVPFDTVAFCQRIDNIITSYNLAAENNVKPNAKGKIKEDPALTMYTKMGISSLLTLYYNCGAFMDAMGKKQESINYFQKFVDLPKITPVFTPHETDSVYKAQEKVYNTARFNLALQNFYLKNWDKAIECADAAMGDTANLHDLFLIKINAYGEKKDSAAWKRTLVEASQKTGRSSYLQNLLYYYIQNNKIDEATGLAEKLTVDAPNDKMSWYMRGAIELNVKKQYEAARQSFEKALAIDPNFEDALFNMGTAYINDIYEQRVSGKFKYIGTNRRIEGKNEAAYKKEKAVYDAELATVKSYYEKARPYMERLRELTPDGAKRWASPLQMIYSSLNMTAEAKQMDALLEQANQAGN